MAATASAPRSHTRRSRGCPAIGLAPPPSLALTPPGLPAQSGALSAAEFDRCKVIAADETVVLLHPPPPFVGVSIAMERERQQNDRTLVDGKAVVLKKAGLPGVADSAIAQSAEGMELEKLRCASAPAPAAVLSRQHPGRRA